MEKIDYITNQFKKTFGKKYENYCITRIYNLVNREDLKIVTQQLFKRNDNKIALADLYLPQINMWIEIDEGQHINNTDSDNNRTKEVIDNNIISNSAKKKYKALDEVIYIDKEKPYRINVYNKSLKEINIQIDNIVNEINTRIINLKENFKPWNRVDGDYQEFLKKGFINVNDDAKFRTLDEIGKLFKLDKLPYDQKMHAYINIKDNYYIWSPTIIIEGNECDNNSWYNIISNDGNYIFEHQKIESQNYLSSVLDNDEIRYVFVKYKDESGRMIRKFKGVFVIDSEKSKKKQVRVWKKSSNQIDL